MIEGSEELDLSLSPKNQEPIAGYVLPRFDEHGNVLAPGSLTLVRNPSWDPATDDLRAAYPDRIEIQIRAEGDPATPSYRAAERALAAAVEAGTVDHVLDLRYSPSQIRRYQEDPQMEGRATTLPVGGIRFIVMNVAMAPFDDSHVRRAVAFAIDERRLLRTLSSASVQAVVASHLAPDDLEGDVLADYDPYPTSLERARQEMALSGYDRDGDGRCDAPECRGVLALMRKGIVGPAAAEEVAARLNAIGIELRLREGGELLWCPSGKRQRWPLFMGCRWASDFPNGSAFLPPLLGLVEVPVPTVDERIDRCVTMTGADQTECWAELDRYLMEEVVPLIPYMADTATFVVSERVATSSYSVPTSGLALDRIALVEGSD
jgi:peptide/nickel transport system substrate-binding protein